MARYVGFAETVQLNLPSACLLFDPMNPSLGTRTRVRFHNCRAHEKAGYDDSQENTSRLGSWKFVSIFIGEQPLNPKRREREREQKTEKEKHGPRVTLDTRWYIYRLWILYSTGSPTFILNFTPLVVGLSLCHVLMWKVNLLSSSLCGKLSGNWTLAHPINTRDAKQPRFQVCTYVSLLLRRKSSEHQTSPPSS